MYTRFNQLIYLATFSFTCIAALIGGSLFFILHNRCIDFSALENHTPSYPTILLDDQGNEWARFQLDRREPIPYEQMPMHLIHAFIATEDWAFFSHSGISIKGIIRSALVNIYHGRSVQGASTITQQLVKLLFFDAQKTFKRKIQEQIYALIIERQCTKQQIMQTYLNHIYFGCGIYGVQAASQRFWGKNVSELTINESATLAAVIRSPLNYCPILCPLSCAKRRNIVARSMHQLNYISDEQYSTILATPLNIKNDPAEYYAPHLKESIRLFLEKRMGRTALYQNGLIVQTTLNLDIQKKAEKIFTTQIQQLRSRTLPGVEGALVTIDVHSGAIKALIGGTDFQTSRFNRASHAKRQIGSTFKPLIYAAAINLGATFADVEIDEPIAMSQCQNGIWQPNNVLNTFEGPMTLARALSYSNNIIAIKTLLRVGIPKLVAIAHQCELPEPIPAYPALALGCIDAAPREVAGMFNIFANDGVYVKPHCISWIKDRWGNKLYKENAVTTRIFSSHVIGQVAHVLSLGLERVKKRNLYPWIDSQAISKTGTSDSRTCWFVGSTPELTTAIYVGHDDARSMGKGIFPIHTAFPIWVQLHHALPCTQKQFVFDPSLQNITVNDITGHRTTHDDPHAITITI